MKPAAEERSALTSARTIAADSTSSLASQTISVVTRMNFKASPGQIWRNLMFYEQIDTPPPLYLRWLLPIPIRTEGAKAAVGDVATCLYEGGHLLKRVKRIDACRLYEFDVVEQDLEFGGKLRLSGGSYCLRELQGGGTEVAITTKYVCQKRPRPIRKPIEAIVCHLFHRHLLSAIRSNAEKDSMQ